MRDLLIEMAQFRIMHECLPHIFEDSIKEQAEWKQVRKQGAEDPAKLRWLGTDVDLDSTALNAIAALGGRKLLEELEADGQLKDPPREPAGKGLQRIAAGSEEVWGGGVPFLVLAEIALKSLLVLRGCIIGSFSEQTGKKYAQARSTNGDSIFRCVACTERSASSEPPRLCSRRFWPAQRFFPSSPCLSAFIGATPSFGPEDNSVSCGLLCLLLRHWRG